MSQSEDRQGETRSRGPRDAKGDGIFIAVTAAIMAVVLTFNSLNVFHDSARVGHYLRPWEPAVWEASSGLVFLVLAPFILRYARRFWPLDPPIVGKLVAHLAGAVAVSLIHVVAAGVMRWAAYRMMDARYNAWGPLGDWPYELRKDVLNYAAIVAIYVAWRWIRDPGPLEDQAGEEVLEVRDGARRHFVPLAEVLWIEAAGNYVELHRGATGLLHRASLSDMERRLERAGFVRIHRSRLVRRDAVSAVESKSTGDFLVRLRDGRELAGSRRFRKPLLSDRLT